MMNKVIEYYYDFKNIFLYQNCDNKYYYFDYGKRKYEIYKTSKELNELKYLMIICNSKFNKIIVNKFGLPFFEYNNCKYVIIENIYGMQQITLNDLISKYDVYNIYNYKVMRNDWEVLISNKIDYYEYQKKHLNNKYSFILDSLEYFLGLSENAISYISNINNKYKYKNVVISHNRILSLLKKDYYNPLNIVLDNRVRDITEYLKYIYIIDNYDIDKINDILKKCDFSTYEYGLLFGRMLYPSFYFDEYEKIINQNKDETKIISYIDRINEYEKYINTIYFSITKIKKIPVIDWLI